MIRDDMTEQRDTLRRLVELILATAGAEGTEDPVGEIRKLREWRLYD